MDNPGHILVQQVERQDMEVDKLINRDYVHSISVDRLCLTVD